MTTLSVSPTYPTPSQKSKVLFTLQQAGANFVRVWVTIAPTGSSLDNKIRAEKDPRNRHEIYSDGGGPSFPFEYVFDKGGKYTFVAQEYIKGSGYGGGYEGDPAGSNYEQKVGSEYTLTLHVGQKLTQVIGPPDARATLNLWVWDSTIRDTYKSIHGEDSPSITASPATDKVKSAIDSTSVKTALANLVGASVSSVIGDLSTLVPEYVNNWNSHTQDLTYHIDPDSVNSVKNSFSTAYTSQTLKDFVNNALAMQRFHFTNDDQTGPDNGNYHNDADRPNLSVYSSATSFDEAYGAFCDLRRCYEIHRTNDTHSLDDDSNVLSASSLLMTVHDEYLSVIADTSPTPPLAQSTGAQLLISGAGFKEA